MNPSGVISRDEQGGTFPYGTLYLTPAAKWSFLGIGLELTSLKVTLIRNRTALKGTSSNH